jgi:hypothetical protein
MSDQAQCGSCSHFGDGIPTEQLVQLRINPSDNGTLVGGCDLDANASIHLLVSPMSSCDLYEAA